MLLDSTYTGAPANPTDKNLAFYDPPPAGGAVVPVGVNLAWLNNGLFRQCKNGRMGCATGQNKQITTCTSQSQLNNNGFGDVLTYCDQGTSNFLGGGTGYLQSSGNVKPGETIEIRFAIWDTSDHVWDSTVVLDNWVWNINPAQPGTIIVQ
jgi:hypothetical protein